MLNVARFRNDWRAAPSAVGKVAVLLFHALGCCLFVHHLRQATSSSSSPVMVFSDNDALVVAAITTTTTIIVRRLGVAASCFWMYTLLYGCTITNVLRTFLVLITTYSMVVYAELGNQQQSTTITDTIIANSLWPYNLWLVSILWPAVLFLCVLMDQQRKRIVPSTTNDESRHSLLYKLLDDWDPVVTKLKYEWNDQISIWGKAAVLLLYGFVFIAMVNVLVRMLLYPNANHACMARLNANDDDDYEWTNGMVRIEHFYEFLFLLLVAMEGLKVTNVTCLAFFCIVMCAVTILATTHTTLMLSEKQCLASRSNSIVYALWPLVILSAQGLERLSEWARRLPTDEEEERLNAADAISYSTN
jgi:hypothetical protein